LSFRDLTQEKELKAILAFSLPMFAGYVFQQLYNVVDMAVLGKLIGTDALAASGAAFPLLFFWTAIMQGLATAFTIVSSHFYGKKNFMALPDLLFNSLLISVVMGLVIIFLGLISAYPAFNLMGIKGTLLPMTMEYYEILLYGSFFMSGYFSLVAIMRGLGDSETPLYLGIVSNLLNLMMDIVFVRYLHFGIWGVALATDMAFVVVFFASIIILSRKLNNLLPAIAGQINPGIITEVFSLGLPNAMARSIKAISIFVFFILVGRFGKEVFTSYAVASRTVSLALSPAFILSIAITAFVGQNYGAGLNGRIKRGFGRSIFLAIFLALAFSLMFISFPNFIMRIFTNDANVIAHGSNYLVIVARFFLLFYLMQVFFGLLKGLGNTAVPMRITWFYILAVQLPVAYFSAFRPFTFIPQNVLGLWWAEPVGWIAGFFVSLVWYLRKTKKNISLT